MQKNYSLLCCQGEWELQRRVVAQLAAILAASATAAYLASQPLLLAIGLAVSGLHTIWRRFSRSIAASVVDEDLVYLVTHMYAIATGKPPRKRLFLLGGVLGDYGEYSRVLKRIALLAVEWGYGFIRAIRTVLSDVKNEVFRDFLLRLGEVLNMGEDPAKFLEIERRTLLSEYNAFYVRTIESARVLLGVYVSAASSSIFLAVTLALMAFLYPIPSEILVLSHFGVAGLLAILAFIIHRSLPQDRLVHRYGQGNPLRSRLKIIVIVCTLLSAVIGVICCFGLGPYLAIALSAFPLILAGLYAKKIENIVKEIDSFYPIFVRSFGIAYSLVGHSPTALRSALRSDYGLLTSLLRRLLARLTLGVNPVIAWRRLVIDTWSELVRRLTNILYDSIDAGADMACVGTVLSDTAYSFLELKKQRKQITKTFEYSLYMVHALLAGIVMAVVKLLNIFDTLLSKFQTIGAVEQLPLMFHPLGLHTVEQILPLFIVLISIINAYAVKVAHGGLWQTMLLPLAVFLLSSGLVMHFTGVVMESLLSNLVVG